MSLCLGIFGSLLSTNPAKLHPIGGVLPCEMKFGDVSISPDIIESDLTGENHVFCVCEHMLSFIPRKPALEFGIQGFGGFSGTENALLDNDTDLRTDWRDPKAREYKFQNRGSFPIVFDLECQFGSGRTRFIVTQIVLFAKESRDCHRHIRAMPLRKLLSDRHARAPS